jgi:hypothetical protein
LSPLLPFCNLSFSGDLGCKGGGTPKLEGDAAVGEGARGAFRLKGDAATEGGGTPFRPEGDAATEGGGTPFRPEGDAATERGGTPFRPEGDAGGTWLFPPAMGEEGTVGWPPSRLLTIESN